MSVSLCLSFGLHHFRSINYRICPHEVLHISPSPQAMNLPYASAKPSCQLKLKAFLDELLDKTRWQVLLISSQRISAGTPRSQSCQESASEKSKSRKLVCINRGICFSSPGIFSAHADWKYVCLSTFAWKSFKRGMQWMKCRVAFCG